MFPKFPDDISDFVPVNRIYNFRAETMVDGLPRAFRFVRGLVVIHDYLGLSRTDFDERPSEPVLIYVESDGPNEKCWKILSEKIWALQGSLRCHIMYVDAHTYNIM